MSNDIDFNDPIESHKAKQFAQAVKDAERVRRHIARPAKYLPRFFSLSPQKRAYMKRFGSRPNRKK